MTVTKEQVYKSLGALLNDALCSRDGYGETRKDYVVVDTYITQLEERVKVLEKVTNEMLEIAEEADRQLSEYGWVDTPGGLECMSDVWNLFDDWKQALAGGKDGA